MKKHRSVPVILFLSIALAAAAALAFWQFKTAQAAEITVRAGRERAYYSALDALTNLETDLSKALIASGPGQHALLLGRVSTLAAAASENLSALPAAYGADEAGLKFLSQTGEYAQTLATAAAEGRTLTENDVQQLSALMQKSGEEQKLSGIEYPSLLYDGPFSDGIRQGTPRGISGEEITAEQAVEAGRAFLGADRAQRAADMQGPIPCWGVAAQKGGVAVNMQVTRQGGKILWMAPETAGFDAALEMDACVERAQAFLAEHGFGRMQPSFTQQYDGLAVVSFAAEQDGVILYPDLVKAQVRMDTGDVVGLEANNFWMNHMQRENLTPAVDESQALRAVSGRLTVTGARLCVIPVDDGLNSGKTEKLCWEIAGDWSGSRYLTYIDAETGEEEKVLKVVQGNGGTLTI